MGGHTQDLKPQHVPGYSGHVPGKDAENLFGSTYGASTAKAIAKEHVSAPDRETKDRFTTSTAAAFNEDSLGL